jgi:hypothetical protein
MRGSGSSIIMDEDQEGKQRSNLARGAIAYQPPNSYYSSE